MLNGAGPHWADTLIIPATTPSGASERFQFVATPSHTTPLLASSCCLVSIMPLVDTCFARSTIRQSSRQSVLSGKRSSPSAYHRTGYG